MPRYDAGAVRATGVAMLSSAPASPVALRAWNRRATSPSSVAPVNRVRSASVSAMSATFLFRLPHDQLRELIRNDGRAASILLVQVVKTLSERLRKANQMLSSVDLLADWLAGSMV